MAVFKGIVKDKGGVPYFGASVVISNNTGVPEKSDSGAVFGTVTGADGSYSLQAPDNAKYLAVKTPSYPTKLKPISKGQQEYNFSLGGEVQEESGVNVIGQSLKNTKLTPFHTYGNYISCDK